MFVIKTVRSSLRKILSFEGIEFFLEIKEKLHIDLDQLNQLPFQVQVTYTDTDGNRALRVLTQLKESTENREIAEVNAYRGVIAENHIRSTANEMMYEDLSLFERCNSLLIIFLGLITMKMTKKNDEKALMFVRNGRNLSCKNNVCSTWTI